MDSGKAMAIRIVLSVALLAACFAVVTRFALSDQNKYRMKVYQDSLALARGDEGLREAIGERMRRDWLIKIAAAPEGGSSEVRIEYVLVGTGGRATMRVRAEASPNRPVIRGLSAEIQKTGEVMHLVP